jgi:hypothetical protein
MDKINFNKIPAELNNIIHYTAPSGDVRIDVYIEDETVGSTQKSMAELFGVEVNSIPSIII